MKIGTRIGAFVALIVLAASAKAQTADDFAKRQPIPLTATVIPLVGDDKDWVNTGGKKIEFERGKVYIVHFWTFGCINCKHNLPSYSQWQKKYAAQIAKGDLVMIGIHTPETKEEKLTENVLREIKRQGITFPVLLDQKAENWKRWGNDVWPCVYLIDKRGKGRFGWGGELEWKNSSGESKMGSKIESTTLRKVNPIDEAAQL